MKFTRYTIRSSIAKGTDGQTCQSTHLNLPFYDDEEFAKLHAAVRMILPILPGPLRQLSYARWTAYRNDGHTAKVLQD